MSQALADVFQGMKDRFKVGVVPSPLTFYFSLGDEDQQKWVLKLTSDACEVEQGRTDGADVVLKTSEELFLKLIRGQWTPGVMDFMRGKIKTNDPDKLRLLKDVFL